jgi:hypothetical protein
MKGDNKMCLFCLYIITATPHSSVNQSPPSTPPCIKDGSHLSGWPACSQEPSLQCLSPWLIPPSWA